MVEPLTATETPRLSKAAPSEAIRSCALEAFTQPLEGLAKK
jgi:hypothetical protein